MLSRTRNEGCLSDLTLDEFLAGQLDHHVGAAAAAHLHACPMCRDRAAEVGRDRAMFRAAPPTFPRRRWRLPAAAGAIAAAAAALVAIAVRPGEPPATRAKGSPHLGYFVTHGDATRTGGPKETVRPGDTLTFTVTTDARRHVAVLSRDGAGAATIYFPAGGTAAAIDSGREVVLPIATRLDDTLGREELYGVFCDRPVALEPLRLALAGTGELRAPPGCAVDRATLDKVAR